MGQPDQCAVKHLALLVDRRLIPKDLARLQAQHAGDCSHQARFATAIAALEQQQTATFKRKREPLEQTALTANQGEIVGG